MEHSLLLSRSGSAIYARDVGYGRLFGDPSFMDIGCLVYDGSGEARAPNLSFGQRNAGKREGLITYGQIYKLLLSH